MVGGSAIGRLVHHERDGPAIVKKVHGDTDRSAIVGGEKSTVEVGEEIDSSAIVGSLGEDAWDGDAHVGLGVWPL